MTEDEAKTKWCPEARVANAVGQDGVIKVAGFVSCNRLHNVREVPQNSFCIGSHCMAWRWIQRITNQEEVERHQYVLGGNKPKPIYENTEHGYCGKAGRP